MTDRRDIYEAMTWLATRDATLRIRQDEVGAWVRVTVETPGDRLVIVKRVVRSSRPAMDQISEAIFTARDEVALCQRRPLSLLPGGTR